MKTDLVLYVGSPEDDPFGTYMYLDLRVEKFDQITLAETEKLDDQHGEVVADEVRKLVNRASVFAKCLKLPVATSMEEISTMCVELDCTDEYSREIRETVREFLKGLKGEL